MSGLLEPGGTLLPIQNGGVPQMLGDRLGECVLGGLSNLGATMTEPGIYEQRNAGHLLIGELAGGESERAERVRQWLGRAVELRVTPNLRGAVWSKLLLNCSVTTLGAVAGGTMREYINSSEAVSYTHLDVYKRQKERFLVVESEFFDGFVKIDPSTEHIVCLLYTSRCV